MTEIDRRHLEAIVAIASAGTITGAAHRLHVSQPALSRTLGQLETMVGVRLVDRSTHHLALTDAGARFVVHAERALASIEAAVVAADDGARPIELGYSWATNEFVAKILGQWERIAPTVPVTATYSEAAADGLLDGRFDVVLMRGATDPKQHRSVTIDVERRWAALPRRHRLAKRTEVTLADLSDETIVQSPHGTTRLEVWPAEVRPTKVVNAPSTDEWMVEVATGHGVGMTVGSIVRSRPHPDIKYVRVVDAPDVELRVVTLRRPNHAHARRFLESVSV